MHLGSRSQPSLLDEVDAFVEWAEPFGCAFDSVVELLLADSEVGVGSAVVAPVDRWAFGVHLSRFFGRRPFCQIGCYEVWREDVGESYFCEWPGDPVG